MDSVEERLARWLATQLGGGEVRVEGLDRASLGHSATTLLVTVVHGGEEQDLAIRVRPQFPGLLEPYDLQREFTILRALEATPVRAPRALWREPTGEVLGQDFYVMERRPGTVYEQGVPEAIAQDPEQVRHLCEGFVGQLAAIHHVDLEATGLRSLGDGRDYLERELAHWSGEIERVKRAPLPALERLVDELRARQPDRCPRVTLVHGDPKPGNFAYVDGEVSAVFDWEMATVGDPRADIGWAEVLWSTQGSFTSLPGALSGDELVARWEALTGIEARHREWYRAFQALKMAVIMLVGSHLFDTGTTDDGRFLYMAYAVRPLTHMGLHELGFDAEIQDGPVLPRRERREAAPKATS